jgi:hypothetical protein
MRFNSVKRGNFSGLASSVNRSMNQAFSAARQSAVDHTSIAKESIKGRGLERRAAMKADADVSRAGMQAFAQVKNTKNDIESKERINDIKRPAKRMAGIVGGLGAIAGGYVMMEGNKKDKAEREELKAERDALTAKQDERWAESDKRYEKLMERFNTKESGGESDPKPSAPDSTGSGSTATPVSSAKPSQPSVKSMSSLTGAGKTLSDAVAKYESGSFGYEAFNQGGAAGGTKVLGKSGNHKSTFGNSLTDMTLSDIFHRQNTKQRGLSMQEHLDSGGLHAVGRYQFIGSTLQDEVRRMGLDPKTTKFTPEVQDNIFLSHIKRVGSISPWVGPMQNYSKAERDNFNNMIGQL